MIFLIAEALTGHIKEKQESIGLEFKGMIVPHKSIISEKFNKKVINLKLYFVDHIVKRKYPICGVHFEGRILAEELESKLFDLGVLLMKESFNWINTPEYRDIIYREKPLFVNKNE